MTPPYFPMPSAEYVIAVALMLTGLMAAAAYIDWTTWRIPKRLTIGMLGLGLVAHMVGGAWLGSQGRPGWMFDGGTAPGIVDGTLFSLAGAVTGFAIFFAFWILSVAGGGDVKHAAALGAWVGPKFFVGILLVCMPVVAVMLVLTMLAGLAMGKPKPNTPAAAKPNTPAAAKPNTPTATKPGKRRLMSFSLPLAIATLLVFLIMFRVPLGLSSQ